MTLEQKLNTGITAYGAYIPRLRMSRQSIWQANAWFAPQLKGKVKGTRALANWDEDSITMSVAAARDLLGTNRSRAEIDAVLFASTTPPFADRLNAGVVSEALNLSESLSASDTGGSQCAALAGVAQAMALAKIGAREVLLTAADCRKTRAGSAQEMDYGDGAAALLLGSEKVLAEIIGEGTVTADFVDHYRETGEDIDSHWEERWVRDEGINCLVPKAINAALQSAGVDAESVDYLIFPSTFRKMAEQLSKVCGIAQESVVDNLSAQMGDAGVAQALIMLCSTLEQALPNQTIVVAGFGSGARALVLRTTEEIQSFQPVRGVAGYLALGTEDTNYTRLLAYKEQLQLDKGMRGEQDKKTALSTSWRHRRALLGLVAGRCTTAGEVHFPPSRLSYTQGAAALDTQEPYPLAERGGRILSWSAESLSSYMAPPHHYGQVDFHGGGRLLMEFTDVLAGEVNTGGDVEAVFRIKDVDDRRHYTRYFWKATPVRAAKGEV